MLKRHVLQLAPDSAAGVADPDQAFSPDLPPDAGLGEFMKGVYEMAGDQNPQPKKDDGQTANGLPGNNATAQPGSTAPKPDAATAQGNQPANKDGKQPDAAKPDDAVKPEPGAAEDDKWPRSNKDWEKLKTARKEEREKLQAEVKARAAEVEDLRTKIKEFETKATLTPEDITKHPEVERLTKLVDEMSNRIRVLDVTQEPRFEAYFKGQIDEQMSVAKEILGEEKAKQFEELSSIPNHPAIAAWKKEQMENFMADLTPMEAATIANVNIDLAKIDRARKSEIAKNQVHVEALKAKQKDQQTASMAAKEKVFTDTVASLGDDKVGIAVFQKKSGDDAWNKGVDARVAEAKRILFGGQGVKGQDLAKAALHAAAYPFILESYAADKAEWEGKISKLEAQVKAMTAAQPSTSRGTATGAASVDSPAGNRGKVGDTHLDPSSAVAEWMKNTIPALE